MKFEAAFVALTLTACSGSHPQPECGGGRACPDGLVCDPPHGDGLVSRCVPACNWEIDGFRCDNGADCWGGRCSAGGSVPEGAIVTTDDACAFGMAPDYDFTGEPRVRRCARVCDEPSECREFERCVEHRCRAVCTVEPNLCDPPNVCVDRVYCTNPRRFARIDCDGDMDLDAECPPFAICDPEQPTGCGRPPAGTE